MKRTIVGILAAIVTLFLTATLAPAQATAAEAKPTRYVGIKVYNVGSQAYLKGHVGPKQQYKLSKVKIQKGFNCTTQGTAVKCNWRDVKIVKTNRMANYNTKINLPRTGKHWYRAVVPARGMYALSRSKPLQAYWV